MSQINAQAMLGLKAGANFAVDSQEFPASPKNGQLAMVNGVMHIYANIAGVITWFPLNNKKDTHVHRQVTNSSEWIIHHNMGTQNIGYFVYDGLHELQVANHQIVDENTVKILLSHATIGSCIMFFDSEKFVPEGFDNSVETGQRMAWAVDVPADLGTVNEGDAVSVSVRADSPYGVPVAYEVHSGQLPPGLSVVDGTLTGTIPEAYMDYTCEFMLKADDTRTAPLYRTFRMAVLADNDVPVWSTDADLGMLEGVVDIQLSATDPEGGGLTYTQEAGTLPAGLTLSSSGLISGETSADGQDYSITVSASDGTNTVNRTFTMSMNLLLATAGNQQTLFPESTMIESGGQGVRYETPGAYSWTVPSGITHIKVWVVGGGSNPTGHSYGQYYRVGGVGGGGAVYSLDVTAGDTFDVITGGVGGTSSFGGLVWASGGPRQKQGSPWWEFWGGDYGGVEGVVGSVGGGTNVDNQNLDVDPDDWRNAGAFGGGAGGGYTVYGNQGTNYGGNGGYYGSGGGGGHRSRGSIHERQGYNGDYGAYGGGGGRASGPRGAMTGVVVIQWLSGILPHSA